MWQLSWCFGQGPAPPSLWLLSLEPLPWPGHPKLPPCPGRLSPGCWVDGAAGRGLRGHPPGYLTSWLSPAVQQDRNMGHAPGPHSTLAPVGTTAMTGIITRIHCEFK
jgi:hypothetical protein